MTQLAVGELKRSLIFLHRWLGVALCVLFLLWFPSGIGMMYWGNFPGVRPADRLQRSPALDGSTVVLAPAEAFAKSGLEQPAEQVRLNSFDGRPVYRFGGGREETVVYADTGELRGRAPGELVHRSAAAWTGLPLSAATIEPVEAVDQWTIGAQLQTLRPMWKYSWPNGEQVYVSGISGEVVQYTTTISRFGAWVGVIPHWLYFVPLRTHQPVWLTFVIWSSGVATIAALFGVVIGVWMYSPAKRYRHAGAPTSLPYRGQKRWHTVLGLVFGLAAATWAFSGMMSLNPFRTSGSRAGRTVDPIPEALRGPRFQLAAFDAKPPQKALAQVAGLDVRDLELTTFAGEPFYMAALAGGETRMIPVKGEPQSEIGRERIVDVVKQAAPPNSIAEISALEQFDLYYVSRYLPRPFPVIRVLLNDAQQTRYYIDPKTGRLVTSYNSRNWSSRWLYHGLHSLDFPWLYNHRPLWDIVMITFMVGGTALCVTSLVLAWRVLGRTLVRTFAAHSVATAAMRTEELAVELD